MAKTLSIDLRVKVVVAVAAAASRRTAAVRFGVSASSAIRWGRAPGSGVGGHRPACLRDRRESGAGRPVGGHRGDPG